jgi:hypothetical protein
MTNRKLILSGMQIFILTTIGILSLITVIYLIIYENKNFIGNRILTSNAATEIASIDPKIIVNNLVNTPTLFTPTIAFSQTKTITKTSEQAFTPTMVFTTTVEINLPAAIKKSVIALYGSSGGDGGHPADYYFGRGMPSLIIYDDGQVIITRRNSIQETYLSTQQVSLFFVNLQNIGYFKDRLSIYNYPEDYIEGAGAPSIMLYANNGLVSKTIDIYYFSRDYLIPDIRNSLKFFSNYYPSRMEPYIPRQMVLWIEEGIGEEYHGVTPEPIEDWPINLPRINELGIGHIVVEEQLIPKILSLYKTVPSGKVFRDNSNNYLVIARPLLPNESPSTTNISVECYITI